MAYKHGLGVCHIKMSQLTSPPQEEPRQTANIFLTGECVTLIIRSIWTNYENVPNHFSATSGTNTRDFASFVIFWLCSLPAIWFPVHKIRHLFTVKAFLVPCAGIAFFIWSIVRAHGIGPIVHQPATKSGGVLGWAMVQGIMSSIANFAALIVNVRFTIHLSPS